MKSTEEYINSLNKSELKQKLKDERTNSAHFQKELARQWKKSRAAIRELEEMTEDLECERDMWRESTEDERHLKEGWMKIAADRGEAFETLNLLTTLHEIKRRNNNEKGTA